MELEELLDSKDLRYILKEIEEGRLSKEGILDNSKFKQKLYDEFEKNGISYDIMRSLVKSFGEKSCIDKIDIDKVMTTNKDRLNIFFTTLMENGKDDLINEVINNEKYTKYFFENLDKNYSVISYCRSNKVMELIDKVKDKENDIPNIEFLPRGLESEDKKKVLDGEYGKKLFLATVYSASNDVLQDYIDKNPKALYTYKDMDVLKLAKNGISFPPEIVKQEEFFNKIKSSNMVDFRRNINIIYRNSFHPSIQKRLKQYESEILKDFNTDTGIFNSYDLNDIDKIKELLDSKDSFLVDPQTRRQLNHYISEKNSIDARHNYYNSQLKSKLNLNFTVDDLNTIDIENITDDANVKNILYRLKEEVANQNEEFYKEKENINSNLKEISNSKFSEVFIDYTFEDTKRNVKINTSEMLRYNGKLVDKEKILNNEKVELYTKINNIDALSLEEKKKLFYDLKDKNMVEELYNDFSSLRRKSYEDINKVLYKADIDSDDLSVQDVSESGIEVHKLKGNPFYMLVRAMDTPIHKETMNEQSCYSLISGNNTKTFHEGYSNYLYGYDSLEPDMVENVFESDSYTFSSEKNITTRPNRLMTPEEIAESSDSYSEINIKNKKSDRQTSRKYDEMKPSYIVAMDNMTKEQIEESKRLNIPIVVIERERYKTKRIDDIEYEEYDNNIN